MGRGNVSDLVMTQEGAQQEIGTVRYDLLRGFLWSVGNGLT